MWGLLAFICGGMVTVRSNLALYWNHRNGYAVSRLGHFEHDSSRYVECSQLKGEGHLTMRLTDLNRLCSYIFIILPAFQMHNLCAFRFLPVNGLTTST